MTRTASTHPLALAVLALLPLALPVRAQESVTAPPAPAGQPAQQGAEERVLSVASHNSIVVSHPDNIERVLITDPDVADVVTVSAREIVLNGMQPGTTTLLFWDAAGNRTSYTVRVTIDVDNVERELRRMFPGEDLQVDAVGNTLILSGQTRDPRVAERARSLAESMEAEATILDHLQVPDRGQVLLRVRIAEVSRNALQDLGSHLQRLNPLDPRGDDEAILAPGGVTPPAGNFMNTPIGPDHTFSDAVNFFLFHKSSNVGAFIQALRTQGDFKSLAEPNLLTLPNETASFLAGGEFPYPVLQAGAQAGAVTIQFQEFGVRLNFTPEITNANTIRLAVEPEVSSLDFSGGLEIGGFQIPVLLSRRANTVVEIADGQTFAIAGLMDNQMTETIRKVPLLGDIPILGAFFRSTSTQQSRTELLVLVTPHLVGPDMEVPELPTGEPGEWQWYDWLRPDTTGTERRGDPQETPVPASDSVLLPQGAGRVR